MKTGILILIIILLIPCFGAAADDSIFEGDVALKGVLLDSEGNEEKLNEYGNLKEGIFGAVRLRYDTDYYFLNLHAGDIGYDTQRYSLDGGMWGKFGYFLNYSEIPHNISSGKSFYSGIGNDNLTNAPNTNFNTWKKFDYSTERQQYGGGMSFDIIKPFYFDFSVQKEKRKGIKPSSGNFFFSTVELPEPVDYETDTLILEGGYSRKPISASISYFYSAFDNKSDFLTFMNPYSGLQNTLTLSPDNKYRKIAFRSSIKLPVNSRFDINIGSSKTKSDSDLLPTFLLPSGAEFSGEVKTNNYDIVLVSSPVRFIDAKVFYRYYRRDNISDKIDDGELNTLFDYRKNGYGIELGFRLPAHLRLITSYSYNKTAYFERIDINSKKDTAYSADIKWNGLDLVTLSAGYERLERNTDRRKPAGPDDAVEEFLGRYDVSPLKRDTYKFSLDLMPAENIDIFFGYRYKKTNYFDTELGLREDKRHEILADASYTPHKILDLYAYFDYEKIRFYQFQRNFFGQTNANPDTQNSTNFNWDILKTEKTYNYGIAADIKLIPSKLTLRLQHDYIKSDGNTDLDYLFASALQPGKTNENIDIFEWDDYRKNSYMVKLIYELSKSFTVTAGYAYEKYSYSDEQLDGYAYTIKNFNVINSYFTGAFKDQSYKASILFLALKYRF